MRKKGDALEHFQGSVRLASYSESALQNSHKRCGVGRSGTRRWSANRYAPLQHCPYHDLKTGVALQCVGARQPFIRTPWNAYITPRHAV
mgnify:CR=1 FL=1